MLSQAFAMKKYAGGVAKYRASEGKCVEVPFRGDVDGTITEILGGVRSTCTYVCAGRVIAVYLSYETQHVYCKDTLGAPLSSR